MTATTSLSVSAAGAYAIACFAQEAAAATNTWNGGGSWTNAVSDGATSSVLHTAVDVQAGPAVNAQLSETGNWTTDTSAYGAGLVLVIAAQAGGFDVYQNVASTTISSGGTDAPAAGTPEYWTAASWSGFPAASNTTFPPVKFHIADSDLPGEVIAVLNTTTGLVMRGANGTTPAAHSAGFTVYNVLTAESSGNLPQVYNPRQYGATGNGSTDDYTALQKALTACRLAGGGTVHVPAGVYVTSQILQVGSNTKLEGDGKGVTTIRMETGASPATIGAPNGLTVLQVQGEQPASNIIVEDITIDANIAGNPPGGSFPAGLDNLLSAAMRLDQVDKLEIASVEVINAIAFSVWLNACTRFQIHDCTILSGQFSMTPPAQQDGIHVTNSQYGAIHDNIVDTGTIYQVGDDGICIQALTTAAGGGASNGGGGPNPPADITITGNVVRSATRGISMLAGGAVVSNITITGNTIWATISDGIILAWDVASAGFHRNITITGNTLRNIGSGGGNGITLMYPGQVSSTGTGWEDVTISGNGFVGFTANAQFGIYCGMGSGLQITGNHREQF
jgi:hypothetical protein